MTLHTRALAESATNTATGYLISLILQFLLLPAMPLRESLAIGAAFTLASLIRGYGIRLLFSRFV